VADNLRLMAVLAHPDDESLGVGGTLARYASEGVQTFLVTATRGENGRSGSLKCSSPEELGRVREAELLAAAKVLGLSDVSFLDYVDGALDRVDSREAISKIAAHITRVRPHVVMTFGPDGAYGHPDHIAISQLTTAAVVYAAHQQSPEAPVAKLYYMAWTRTRWDAYQAALKKLTSKVDGVERQATPWPDWAVTTVIDTAKQWPVVWRAVSCHESQISAYENLRDLPAAEHQALWGSQEFYRAFSLVNGGRRRETDLFEGLRQCDPAMEDGDECSEWIGAAPRAVGRH
jgi:LmbE family N-acetylglucosaminyl deacetylase